LPPADANACAKSNAMHAADWRFGVQPELRSEITCPHCRRRKIEIMPVDACQILYTCERCNSELRPKPGDCCVFCSYGSVACPPMQRDKNCCGR
jgi:hypothetical protein